MKEKRKPFEFTELEDGEKVVFGPVTSTKTTGFSGGTGPTQSSVSKTTGHIVGVTNQRVIFEDLDSPDNTRVVPNADVQRVFTKRKQRGGQQTITLSRVQTTSGQAIKLNIMGLPSQAESVLKTTFPNAEITQDTAKGCPLAAAVLLGFPSLACGLFVLVPLLFGMLGG